MFNIFLYVYGPCVCNKVILLLLLLLLFKFNIILKIYIFHLTVVMINSNKCLTQKKIENVRCLFYSIQD